jgi:hypothetical protein
MFETVWAFVRYFILQNGQMFDNIRTYVGCFQTGDKRDHEQLSNGTHSKFVRSRPVY